MIMVQKGETNKGCISVKCNQFYDGIREQKPMEAQKRDTPPPIKFRFLVQPDQRVVPSCDSWEVYKTHFQSPWVEGIGVTLQAGRTE